MVCRRVGCCCFRNHMQQHLGRYEGGNVVNKSRDMLQGGGSTPCTCKFHSSRHCPRCVTVHMIQTPNKAARQAASQTARLSISTPGSSSYLRSDHPRTGIHAQSAYAICISSRTATRALSNTKDLASWITRCEHNCMSARRLFLPDEQVFGGPARETARMRVSAFVRGRAGRQLTRANGC